MVNFINSFNPQQGLLVAIAFDPVSGNIFIYDDFANVIRQYRPNGAVVSTTPFNGIASNDIDLDFAPEEININGTTIIENALLVANGDINPETLTAINKTTGAVIGPNGTVFNIALPTTSLVGGAYHATRNTFFAVNYGNDTIQEINLATGIAINSFPVVPTGSPAFDVFYGDVEVNQASGNLFIVSSSQNKIRELTPTGAFVRDINVSTFGVTGMSGIAFDDAKGEAYISSTNGSVYRLSGFAALPATPTITLAISPTSVTENGTTNLVYTFTRSGSTTTALNNVNFNVGGTATFNNDYTQTGATTFSRTTGKINFAAGSATARVIVDPNGDTTVEPNETAILTLATGTGYTLTTPTAVTGTITNDDGDANNNTITGGTGNDSLNGLAGNDTLTGGPGNDTLTGSSGRDRFVFNSPNDKTDRITDFVVVDDTIAVSRTGFGSGLAAGSLPASQFIRGTAATTASHRFIYNNATGGLLFDADGIGGNGAIQIATLSTGLAMTNANFVVI